MKRNKRFSAGMLAMAAALTFLLPTCALAEEMPLPTYAVYEETILCAETAEGEASLRVQIREDLVLIVDENTLILDNAAMAPIKADTLKAGEPIKVWASQATTRSIPAQTYAYCILTNIEAGAKKQQFGSYFTAKEVEDKGDSFTFLDSDETIYVTVDKADLTGDAPLAPGTACFAWYWTVAASEPAQTHALGVFVPARRQISGTVAVDEDHNVLVNGVSCARKAYFRQEEAYLPVAQVCEALGYTARWDSAEKTMTLMQGDETLATLYSRRAECTGFDAPHTLTLKPRLSRGQLFAPASFFALLGIGVDVA